MHFCEGVCLCTHNGFFLTKTTKQFKTSKAMISYYGGFNLIIFQVEPIETLVFCFEILHSNDISEVGENLHECY